MFEKLLGPSNLPRAKVFHFSKFTKAVMVDKYKNFMLATFYVVVICFENFNNCQIAIIISFIPSSSKNYFLQIVSN